MIYVPEVAVFIHVPRTGGMAFKRAVAPLLLGDHCGVLISDAHFPGRARRHARAHGLSRWLPDWSDIRRVLVVRNPWRWCESYWRQMNRYSGTESSELQQCRQRTLDLSFGAWVRYELSFVQPGSGLANHWGRDRDGTDLGVECLRFEDPAHRQALCQAFRLPADTPIPQQNHSPARQPLQWTDEAIAFIRERFVDDFERFGYPDHPSPR